VLKNINCYADGIICHAQWSLPPWWAHSKTLHASYLVALATAKILLAAWSM